MSAILSLVREDLREFAGYSSARRAGVTGKVWLNANESAWRNPADAGLGANRYPDPQPAALRERLGELYGVRADQVLVGRGSDEAIDLLVRALCVPGRDAVVVSPPVFGMYAVSARLQGAPLVEVPLRDTEAGFASDLNAMADAAVSSGAKLVFVCSPANPTGQAIAPADLLALARRLAGRCLVVVDEAYGEYCDQASMAAFIDQQPNLAVLRTLSKAHALAAHAAALPARSASSMASFSAGLPTLMRNASPSCGEARMSRTTTPAASSRAKAAPASSKRTRM